MSAFDDIIRTLGKLTNAKALAEKIAAESVAPLTETLTKTLAAGESPEGKPWESRKEGGRAYANAASKLKVYAKGDLLIAETSGPEAYAQRGTGRLPIRQQIPDAGAEIPRSVTGAIEKAAAKVIGEASK